METNSPEISVAENTCRVSNVVSRGALLTSPAPGHPSGRDIRLDIAGQSDKMEGKRGDKLALKCADLEVIDVIPAHDS